METLLEVKDSRAPRAAEPHRTAGRAAAVAGMRRSALGELARRANAGPHVASLAATRDAVAQRACADCESVRRRMRREPGVPSGAAQLRAAAPTVHERTGAARPAQPRPASASAPDGGHRVAQRCAACGGPDGACACSREDGLPGPVRKEVDQLSRGAGPRESALALDRAYPRLLRRAGGRGEGPPVQRAACGNAGTEWYTGARGAAAARLSGATNMDIAPDLAHILCCAFCEAMIRTWAGGGKVVGGINLRYTRLFEHLVHQFHGETAVTGGGTRNVFTEEAYWIPANAANFAVLTGLPAQNAHLIDQGFWNAVQAVLNAPFNTAGGGVYPAGLPGGEQAGFDARRGDPTAFAFAPAGVQRRSYATQTIINGGVYTTLRWLSQAAGGGGGTAWDNLRDLAGRMRILDFAGERTPAGGGAAATRHTVADAKFSYIAGHHDAWGPGQAADQQTIYQEISGGGPGNAVPVVTWDRCGCNEILAKQIVFDQQQKEKLNAGGKRKERDLVDRAEKTRGDTEKRLRFIDSATVKWVS